MNKSIVVLVSIILVLSVFSTAFSLKDDVKKEKSYTPDLTTASKTIKYSKDLSKLFNKAIDKSEITIKQEKKYDFFKDDQKKIKKASITITLIQYQSYEITVISAREN